MHPITSDLQASLLREERLRLASEARRAQAPSSATAAGWTRRALRSVRRRGGSAVPAGAGTPARRGNGPVVGDGRPAGARQSTDAADAAPCRPCTAPC
jgi:hypothetical protein